MKMMTMYVMVCVLEAAHQNAEAQRQQYYGKRDTGWRRGLGCLKLQVSSAKEPVSIGLFCGE